MLDGAESGRCAELVDVKILIARWQRCLSSILPLSTINEVKILPEQSLSTNEIPLDNIMRSQDE